MFGQVSQPSLQLRSRARQFGDDTLTYTQGYHDGMLHRVVLDQGRSEPCVGNRHHKPLNVKLL